MLTDKVTTFLASKGKDLTKPLGHPRCLVALQDNADGKGAFIAEWHPSLGAVPVEADGFTTNEVKQVKAAAAAALK